MKCKLPQESEWKMRIIENIFNRLDGDTDGSQEEEATKKVKVWIFIYGKGGATYYPLLPTT